MRKISLVLPPCPCRIQSNDEVQQSDLQIGAPHELQILKQRKLMSKYSAVKMHKDF